jgi:hypothetical protein
VRYLSSPIHTTTISAMPYSFGNLDSTPSSQRLRHEESSQSVSQSLAADACGTCTRTPSSSYSRQMRFADSTASSPVESIHSGSFYCDTSLFTAPSITRSQNTNYTPQLTSYDTRSPRDSRVLTQEQFIRTNPSFPDPPRYLSLSDAYSRPLTHPLHKKRYPGDRLYTADFNPDQIRAGCARFFIELNWDWWDTYRPGGWNALGNQLWERVFGDYEDYCEGKKNGELFLVLIDAARVLLHEIDNHTVRGRGAREGGEDGRCTLGGR